jgi:TetR/AcrR family transcriptional repressor of mexJK operon
MAPAPETAAHSHADELPRSARKRTAILDAATTVFLRNGYLGTSMDEIAALAGVSKQTVYKHFTDKESLFTQIVTTTVKEAGDPALGESLELEDGDLETSLQELARRLLAGALQPKVL